MLRGRINDPTPKRAVGTGRGSDASRPVSLGLDVLTQVQQSLVERNRQKDGSVSSFQTTVRDISMVPTTQAEKDYWYSSDGANFVAGTSDADSADYKEMIQAIKDRKIDFIDASTVPDLNYHNMATFQGGEGGGSPGLTRTYNAQASIFKDPARGYFAMADGTLISWEKKGMLSS